MRIWHYGPMENFSSFGIQGKLSAASLRLVLQYNKARKAAKLSPPKALDRTRFKVFVFECLQFSEKIKNFFGRIIGIFHSRSSLVLGAC